MTLTIDVGRAARLVLGAGCALLLLSMGGAGIYAAPVTLPLLWLAGWRASGRGGRIALNVVAALTAGEFAWAVGYAFGRPYEWLLPLFAVAAVGVGYPLTQRVFR